MPNPTFKQGSIGEEYVCELLDSAGIPYRMPEEKLLEWDIEADLNERQIHIEVKYDLLQARTGNIALEYHNNRANTVSGILATTSDIWVVVLDKPRAAWMANTEELRDYFHHGPKLKDIQGGDGGYAASLRLFRSKDILTVFEPMNVSPWEIFSTLLSLVEKDFSICK